MANYGNPADTVDLMRAYDRALVLHAAIDANARYEVLAAKAGKPTGTYEAKIDRYETEIAALGEWLGRPGFFAANRRWKLRRQFVEHVANILYSGPRVYPAGSVTDAQIRRAYELTTHPDLDNHNLNPEYFDALEQAAISLED